MASQEELNKALLKASGGNSFFDQSPPDPAGVEAALANGANVACRDVHGWTPLMWAARYDKSRAAAVVQRLVGADSPLNAQKKNGSTALMNASLNNNPEAVRVLVAAGADTSLRTYSGKTAEDIAREKGYTDIVAMLQATVVAAPAAKAATTVFQAPAAPAPAALRLQATLWQQSQASPATTCDAELTCAGGPGATVRVPVAACFLQARYPHFARSFQSHFAEFKNKSIEVPGASEACLKAVVEYAYTGRLPDGLGFDDLFQLMVIADRWEEDDLCEACGCAVEAVGVAAESLPDFARLLDNTVMRNDLVARLKAVLVRQFDGLTDEEEDAFVELIAVDSWEMWYRTATEGKSAKLLDLLKTKARFDKMFNQFKTFFTK